MNCKNQPDDCHCWQHAEGLMAYTTNPEAYTHALNQCRPTKVVLSVLTRDDILSVEKQCDNTMTCICRRCSRDRAARKTQTQAQPWMPRAARQRAA